MSGLSLMPLFSSTYEVFNYLECAAWMVIAGSDYLEAPTHGQLPPWLWAWKLLCAASLLHCRYDYLGKEQCRWNDRSNLLAMACFFAVLLAMFLQHHFRDLLSE